MIACGHAFQIGGFPFMRPDAAVEPSAVRHARTEASQSTIAIIVVVMEL
jgi:hypothetical protein